MSDLESNRGRPIVILGGGINGAAAARELILQGQSVVLLDTADLAAGATACSSRLIHGGLRYLEYGEFDLVRESLRERTLLLKLAPDFVRPLRLFVPVTNRWGGLWQSTRRFLGWKTSSSVASRGLYLVRLGLLLYDIYARDPSLPKRGTRRYGAPGTPQVDARSARWFCAYSDAQISFPERFVVALLQDAQIAAKERGVSLQVLPYHRAELHGDRLEICPIAGNPQTDSALTIHPSAIINATGAWVDATLARLPVPSRRLMGGTKGSHLYTLQPRLKELLGGNGVYTEAKGGRPVFILPFLEGTLIGTTDIPFAGDPAAAVAADDEVNYLLGVVSNLFPAATLSRSDLLLHYCGVRPLPFVDQATPAAITRRHQLVWNESAPLPLVSLVGGKLTTCRALAEEVAAAVLQRLGQTPKNSSLQRPIPRWDSCASDPPEPAETTVTGTSFTTSAVRRVIQTQWVTRLSDLVERRLMLLYEPRLTVQSLEALAQVLVAEGKLVSSQVCDEVAACVARLKSHFGRVV